MSSRSDFLFTIVYRYKFSQMTIVGSGAFLWGTGPPVGGDPWLPKRTKTP